MQQKKIIKKDVLTELRKVCEENHIPIIRRDTEAFIGKYIKKNKPEKILEIGTAVGYSAMFFANSCSKAKILSVDNDDYALAVAAANISKVGLDDRIELLHGDGAKVISKLKEKYDVIFIDGGKSHYLEFIENIKRISHEGTVIISDDIGQRGMTEEDVDLSQKAYKKHRTSARRMNEFIEYIKESKDFETELHNIGDGLAVSIYKEK